MGELTFQPGQRIKIINGLYNGRSGEYIRSCSVVFNDHCRVKLDLKGRERNQKYLMIAKAHIEHE